MSAGHKSNIAPGEKFGRLEVISSCGQDKYRHEIWLCKCQCGNYTKVRNSNLLSGGTKSCGCLEQENRKSIHIIHGDSKGSKLYKVWHSMICRCELQKDTGYKHYGGRGITVCKEWHSYESFKKWAMQSGYKENPGRNILTIDRVNNDGNYCPENCRWVDMKVQASNRRSSYGERRESEARK